jgi:Family of unknown function (DUF6370)
MKTVLTSLFALAMGCALVFGIQAQEQKEVTLKGTILCAKCSLKQETKCTTAVQVKDGDKTVTYLLQDKGNGETYHEPVCGGDKQTGTVIGTVSEKDGKKWVKPTKVEYTK